MSKSRRTLLWGIGGAGLMLVGGGALFVATRRPSAALRAWDAAKASSSDPRLEVFRHAILAPNPHNRQPWQIELIGQDEAVIACDLDRRLPQTDPFDRQITIGFGCFLELARIAAAERGLRMDTALFPQGEPVPRLTTAPIAHLRFVPEPGVARDPLFWAIPIRRSAKVRFASPEAVAAGTLDALTRAGGEGTAVASSDPALVADLRALTWRAWMIEATTPRTWQESVDLMRIGRSEIEANPDGIALGGAVLEALALAGQISRRLLADPTSRAFRSGVDRYQAIFEQTPSYLWVTTPGNARFDQIAAGRAYIRVNLAAAASGVSLHPVSQALQEFPEMAVEFDALHARLGINAPQRIQMLARVGYAAAVDASARWPLEAKLKSS